MKRSRRDFFKLSGHTGFGLIGADTLSGCSSDSTDEIRTDTNWQIDPEWQEITYGEWGGPGVDPRPGPMDYILLKDYAPKSSVIVPETFIPKPLYPVIDVHIHNYPEREGGSPSDLLSEWVNK